MNENKMVPLVVKQILSIEESLVIKSKAELTLIYIQQGKGIVCFDSQSIPFQKGKLFLIPFDTQYIFKSEKDSKVLIVECPQYFITQIRLESDRIETCDNMYKLTYITHNFHTREGCVFHIKEDGILAEQLLFTIEREYLNPIQDYLIIRQCMAIILNLVARNLRQNDFSLTKESKKNQDVMKLITYVQKNIANRKSLSLESLSKEFGIAKSYVGEYFKKQAGVSLQDYILDYKLKLVEIRLKHSTMRLKEIAFELDFNDESHLSKIFKKFKGMSPSKYRILHKD